jgi:prevent-host-death family protein
METAMTAEVTTASYRDFRDHLADYLRRARDGEEIVVTSHGEPMARLLPPQSPQRLRLGSLEGKLRVPDSIVEGTPDDIIAAMEGCDRDDLL